MGSQKSRPHAGAAFGAAKAGRKTAATDIVILAAALVAFVSVTVYIFFSFKYFFHSDAATSAMITYEQNLTGNIFLKSWVYSQDFWPFFTFNPVTLLWPVFRNAYLCTQIPVFIQTAVNIVLSYFIMRRVYHSRLNILILSVLFAGMSGYWMNFMVGQGQYGNVIMWILICITCIGAFADSPDIKKGAVPLAVLFLVNFFINTTGVRYIPLYSGASLLALAALFFMPAFFGNKKIRNKILILAADLGVSTLLGAAIFRVLEKKYCFVTQNTGAVYVGYEGMLKNIGGVVTGFFACVLDNNNGMVFASKGGIACAVMICVTASLIIASLINTVKNVTAAARRGQPAQQDTAEAQKEFFRTYIESYTLVAVLIQLFALVFTEIGGVSALQSCRYMAVGVFMLMLLSPDILKKLSLNMPEKRSLRTFAVLILVPVILLGCYSLNRVITTENTRTGLVDYLEENGLKYGYATYWNADAYTVLSNYKVKIYHVTIGDKQNNAPLRANAFLSCPEQYKRTEGDGSHFIMLEDSEYTDSLKEYLNANLGQPDEILKYDKFNILVYGGDIISRMPNFYEEFENFKQ